MTLTKKIMKTANKMLDFCDLEKSPENIRAILTAMRDEKEFNGELDAQSAAAFNRLLMN